MQSAAFKYVYILLERGSERKLLTSFGLPCPIINDQSLISLIPEVVKFLMGWEVAGGSCRWQPGHMSTVMLW